MWVSEEEEAKAEGAAKIQNLTAKTVQIAMIVPIAQIAQIAIIVPIAQTAQIAMTVLSAQHVRNA